MEREELKDLAERIRAHPRFQEAAARAIRDYLAWRIRLGVLNKLISNLGRERILERVDRRARERRGGRLGGAYRLTRVFNNDTRSSRRKPGPRQDWAP